MKTLLAGIFEKYNYQMLANKYPQVLKHKDFDDFWMICDYEDGFLEKQSMIMKSLEGDVFHEHKEAEKNMSAIILFEVKAFDEALNQLIVEMENDPFCFKKYVLAYTEEDLKEAKEILKDNDVSDFIMRKNNFDSLKKEKTESTGRIGRFHLIYALSHKLPFLMTNVRQKSTEGLVNHFYTQNHDLQELYDWALAVNPDTIEKEIIKLATKIE